MIKNGYLKDMNDLITQDKIIKVLNDEKLIHEYNKNNLDFYKFLFFLDVDFSGKVPHDMKKVNSIVANYTDYMKDRTIV